MAIGSDLIARIEGSHAGLLLACVGDGNPGPGPGCGLGRGEHRRREKTGPSLGRTGAARAREGEAVAGPRCWAARPMLPGRKEASSWTTRLCGLGRYVGLRAKFIEEKKNRPCGFLWAAVVDWAESKERKGMVVAGSVGLTL